MEVRYMKVSLYHGLWFNLIDILKIPTILGLYINIYSWYL